MKIKQNGKIIILDENGIKSMLDLVCVCGHKLSEHSFTNAYGRWDKYITSQCVRCGFHEVDDEHPQGFICEQFRIESGKNDSRWFNFDMGDE